MWEIVSSRFIWHFDQNFFETELKSFYQGCQNRALGV